jgi:DNA modification methylase
MQVTADAQVTEPLKKTPWAADSVERRILSELKGYEHNSRTHTDAQVAQIAASIREWGWTVPVLIDETNTIIAGHARVLAAKQSGLTEVPCVVARGWTEDQKHAYVIADNKLTLNGGWDQAMLSSELQHLGAVGFDLDLTGFDEPELAALLAAGYKGLTDPDNIPELQALEISKPGDIWILGSHRLMCGDSTVKDDVDRLLSGIQPSLMVTDPPYGVEYDGSYRSDNPLKAGKVTNDSRKDWREAWTLFPGNVAYVWHASYFISTVQESLEAAGFEIRCQIIWAKDRFAMSRGHYHWQHEPCWYAVRKGATANWAGDRKQTSLWNIPAREDNGHGHPTQKPVECMRRPIQNNSNLGQAVYEPFNGSGTTIIAAETTGRVCYGMEIAPKYVDVAVRRWQTFTGQEATLERTGETFNQRQALQEQSAA